MSQKRSGARLSRPAKRRTTVSASRRLGGIHDGSAREIIYDVVVDQQGKGYAREASEALVDYAMREAGIPKLVAFLRPENTRAVAE